MKNQLTSASEFADTNSNFNIPPHLKKQTMKQTLTFLKKRIFLREKLGLKIQPGLILFLLSLNLFSFQFLSAQTKVALVEVRVEGDVDIREGIITDVWNQIDDRYILDPIWKTTLDANGKPLPPIVDDPIADYNGFEYRYWLNAWPIKPDWTPRVQYKWEIKGAKMKSDWQWQYVHHLAWTGDFQIPVPNEVGKYKLKVELKIFNGNKQLRHEKLEHTLYVLYAQPLENPLENWGTDIPRISWLELATKGANGLNNEDDILISLTEYVHSNPLKWGYGIGDNPTDNPLMLLEDWADGAICSNFRDTWRILAASLGIATNKPIYKYPKDRYSDSANPTGVSSFITSLQPAIDKNFSANGYNTELEGIDRWRFNDHFVGTNQSRDHFYDPTFGLHGPFQGLDSDLEGNVICKVYGNNPDEENRHKCYFTDVPAGSNYGYILAWKEDDPTTDGWTEFSFSLPNPLRVKQYVLNKLTAMIPSGDVITDIQLTKAITNTSLSLSPQYWVAGDSVHLTGLGKKVFDEEKKAVKELDKISYAPVAGKLMKIFDLLVLADETLARQAIEDAVAAGVDSKKVNKAEKEMDKAGKEIKKWKFEKGILHLKKAWEHMQKELNQGRLVTENNTLLWAEQDPEAILLYCYSSDSEKTNEKFIIERSYDGIHFTKIYEVEPLFEAYQTKSYTHLDVAPFEGKNFYRLYVEYSDGSFKFTEPIQVNFTPISNLTLYPNPADSYALIDLSEYKGLEADIMVSHNSVVLFKDHLSEIIEKNYELNLSGITNGFYQVYIKVEGKRAISKKLIVIKSY